MAPEVWAEARREAMKHELRLHLPDPDWKYGLDMKIEIPRALGLAWRNAARQLGYEAELVVITTTTIEERLP